MVAPTSLVVVTVGRMCRERRGALQPVRGAVHGRRDRPAEGGYGQQRPGAGVAEAEHGRCEGAPATYDGPGHGRPGAVVILGVPPPA